MVYDRHSYDPEKRQALDAWAQRLEAIVTGQPAAKVIPLRAWPPAATPKSEYRLRPPGASPELPSRRCVRASVFFMMVPVYGKTSSLDHT